MTKTNDLTAKLLNIFNALNNCGREKAVERINEMSLLPEYTRDNSLENIHLKHLDGLTAEQRKILLTELRKAAEMFPAKEGEKTLLDALVEMENKQGANSPTLNDIHNSIFNWSTEVNSLYVIMRVILGKHGDSKYDPDDNEEIAVLLETVFYKLADLENAMDEFSNSLVDEDGNISVTIGGGE